MSCIASVEWLLFLIYTDSANLSLVRACRQQSIICLYKSTHLQMFLLSSEYLIAITTFTMQGMMPHIHSAPYLC